MYNFKKIKRKNLGWEWKELEIIDFICNKSVKISFFGLKNDLG